MYVCTNKCAIYLFTCNIPVGVANSMSINMHNHNQLNVNIFIFLANSFDPTLGPSSLK